jgi:two-component sensor histidine kinase
MLRVLQDLRSIRTWPLWIRVVVMGVAFAAAFVLQIPLERDWPGEPFLLFLFVVIGTTLCFGIRLGLVSVALSTFLSLYFFEPIGSLALRYSSDLDKILLYAVLALGSMLGFAYLGDALIYKSDSDRTKSVLLREMMHGVANNFAAIASLIQIKAASVTDVAAKSVLDDVSDQVRVMARVHQRLRAGDEGVSVDSKAFIEELCGDLKASTARGRPISIECSADSRRLPASDAVSLGLIINELVTNATKHAFPDRLVGRIRVDYQVSNDESCLCVEDDGVGFAEHPDAGMGQDLVRALSQQLGGELSVNSTKSGTTFRLSMRHLSAAKPRPDTLLIVTTL